MPGKTLPTASNTEFDRRLTQIRQFHKSSLDNQRRIALVLSSVEEGLASQGISSVSPDTCLSAVISLIPQIAQSANESSSGLIYAVVYLMELSLSHASRNLIDANFSTVLSFVLLILRKEQQLPPAAVYACIGIVDQILRFESSSTQKKYEKEARLILLRLLECTGSPKPKTRKLSRECLCSALESSGDQDAKSLICKGALASIKSSPYESKNPKEIASRARIIHNLQLISAVFERQLWPDTLTPQLIKILPSLCSPGSEYLASIVFQIFGLIFDRPSSSELTEVLSKAFHVVFKLKPIDKNAVEYPDWTKAIARGLEYLKESEDLESIHYFTFIERQITDLTEDSEKIREAALNALIILSDGFPEISKSHEASKRIADIMYNGLRNLTLGKNYQDIFFVSGLFIENFPEMISLTKTIADLRKGANQAAKEAAEKAVAIAVKKYGPERILSEIPLNLLNENEDGEDNAWLLPILRENITNANLGHFVANFVPLCEKIDDKIKNFSRANKGGEVTLLTILTNQIWSLLPRYCIEPKDLAEVLSEELIGFLVNVLYQQKDLRSYICKALTNLVSFAKEAPSNDENSVPLTRKLAPFCETILSALYNIYIDNDSSENEKTNEAIEAWLSISTKDSIANLVTKAIEITNLEEKGTKKSTKAAHSAIDFLISAIPHIPAEQVSVLYKLVKKFIRSEDPVIQKKGFRALAKLIESGKCSKFFRSKLKDEDLQSIFTQGLEISQPASRRNRIIALRQVINILPDDKLHFIPQILPEIILSTKEVNEKARSEAFDMLISIAARMKKGGKISLMQGDSIQKTHVAEANLEEYITIVSAGLASPVARTVSATILSLSRLIYEYHEELPSSLITKMLDVQEIFLSSKNHEIAKSALGLLKVCLLTFPASIVQERLPNTIEALLYWSHEHKAHLKYRVKHMFERLIKKFGINLVTNLVPEADQNLMKNIKKTIDRRKRQSQIRADEADMANISHADTASKKKSGPQNGFDIESESESFDSDLDFDEVDEHKSTSKQKIYLQENAENPIDLLDPRAVGQISYVDPEEEKKMIETLAQRRHKLLNRFKSSQEGRLIIEDDDQEAKSKCKLLSEGSEVESQSNIFMDSKKNSETYKRTARNKVRFSNKRVRNEDDDDEEEEVPVQRKDKRKTSALQKKKNRKR